MGVRNGNIKEAAKGLAESHSFSLMTRLNEKMARKTEKRKGMVMLGKWRDFHGELWGENLLRNALSLLKVEAKMIMGKYKV